MPHWRLKAGLGRRHHHLAPTAAAGKGKARRPSKKAKKSGTAEAASSTDNGTGPVTDIPCHAVILSSRSPYFDSALSRGWSEGEKKVVEIALADEAAVEDLKLLLKLSYGESYIMDGGNLFDRATRLRLAELADALEFGDAVGEYLKSLGHGLTLESAIICLDEIPERLRGNCAVFELTTDVQNTIVSGIDYLVFDINIRLSDGEDAAAQFKLLAEAGIALAKMVGPVEKFFQFNETRHPIGWGFYTMFNLPDDILAMPSEVIRVLLESDALQVKCEDETYYFLIAYLAETPHFAEGEQQIQFFRSVYDALRFEHFSLAYVWNVLHHCPFVQDNCSDLSEEIMRRALSRRDVCPKYLLQAGLTLSPRDRSLTASTGMQPTWTFETVLCVKFPRRLKRGEQIILHTSMIGGFPLNIYFKHLLNGTCGLYFSVIFPDTSIVSRGKDLRGVGMRLLFNVGSSEDELIENFFSNREGHGSATCLDQEAWWEVRKHDRLHIGLLNTE